MKHQPVITRAYRFADTRMMNLEIHDHDCQCTACEPYAPSCPDRLDATAIGKLAVAGVLVGSAIAFAIDPAGAAAALLATLGL